ncbi:hypothetical protein MMC13_001417 [Lambiella insularis]|nr:hypothetical protein [Lambiella insularis]
MSMFALPPMNGERYGLFDPASATPSLDKRLQSNVGLGLDYSDVPRPIAEYRRQPNFRRNFPYVPKLPASTNGYIHLLSSRPQCTNALDICRPLLGSRIEDSDISGRFDTADEDAVTSGLASISSASVVPEQDKLSCEEDETADTAMGQEDELTSDDTSKTAAERQAERRKMKRFRLTHHQTRFLMSEFAKQAHPDAAQRERLSKDIPGLSTRQVQVWFQNRRAKLKRFTSDDRERMMSTRALPDGFDMTPALQYPLETQTYLVPGFQALEASPISYAHTYNIGGTTPPLTRRNYKETNGTTSNTQIIHPDPPCVDLYSPTSITQSQTVSPISSLSENALPIAYLYSSDRNNVGTNPSNISKAFPTSQQLRPHNNSVQFHDSSPKTMAGTFAQRSLASTSHVNDTVDQRLHSPSFVDTASQEVSLNYAGAYHLDVINMNQILNHAFGLDGASPSSGTTSCSPGLAGTSQSQPFFSPSGIEHTSPLFEGIARRPPQGHCPPVSTFLYDNRPEEGIYMTNYSRS